jgi:hypothetical protein
MWQRTKGMKERRLLVNQLQVVKKQDSDGAVTRSYSRNKDWALGAGS